MATLKNTTIKGTESLKLPSGTTAQRPTNPTDGETRFNTDTRKVEYYLNGSWYAIDRYVQGTATGTTFPTYTAQTSDNDIPYTVHTWTGTGSFEVLYGGVVEYMLIGGGGGGGEGSIYDDGPGGGAGGMLIGTTQVKSRTYTIQVGGGGAGSSGGSGGKGGDTVAFDLTAFGGGGGAGHRRDAPYYNSGNGVIGSGGGAAGAYATTDGNTDGITQGGQGTPGQGFDGGSNNYRNYLGAGGGGAGAPGTGRHGDGNAGAGGRGRMSTITGYPVWYAGGGSGYGYNSIRSGGLGGGGTGSFSGRSDAYPGADNSGGGGGGGTSDQGDGRRSKIGGRGIVVVRYIDPSAASGRPDILRENNSTRILTLNEGLVFELDAADPGSYNYGKAPRTWLDRYNNVDITLDGTGLDIYSTANGGAIKFSTSTYVSQGWPAALDVDDNVTRRAWEVWAKPRTAQTTAGIFGHKVSSGCSYYCNGGIFIWNGKWAFNWYDNSSYRFLDSGVTATADEWAHVVCGFDKDRLPRIYVNGVLRATYGSVTNMNYSNGMDVVNIGYNDKDGGNSYFDGDIAICRFYKGSALREIGAQRNFEAHRGRFGL